MADPETLVRKFRAVHARSVTALPKVLKRLGCPVGRGQRRVVCERYLDTDDWRLYRAGAACRLRRSDTGASLALEPLSGRPGAGAISADLEERLSGRAPTFPAPIPGRRIAAWLDSVMGTAPVRDRIELERTQTVYRGSTAEGLRLEASASVVRLSGADARGRFAELDLTVAGGSREDRDRVVERVASALKMDAAEGSTCMAALGLAGIEPPDLVEGNDLVLRTDDRFVDAAYRVLRRHFNRMQWNEPGTRLGLDAEYLHDMRVATRRMRAALSVFRDALPRRRRQALRRDLRWLGRVLGQVRDLDVYLIHLEDEVQRVSPDLRSAMDLYVARLRERREAARRTMLRALSTARYATFVERFEKFLDAGPPARPSAPRATAPVTAVARRVIRKRLRRVLHDGRAITPGAPDTDLHQLRIRCKRLRYACEFFVDIYGPRAAAFAKRVTHLQDLLGAHQDAVVARETLAAFAEGITAPRDRVRPIYLAVGQLTMLHEQRARRSRAQFFKAWKRFDLKRVRRPLKTRLDRLR